MNNEERCSNRACGGTGVTKYRCSACHKTGYCSKTCQKAHWREEHKIQCGDWQKQTEEFLSDVKKARAVASEFDWMNVEKYDLANFCVLVAFCMELRIGKEKGNIRVGSLGFGKERVFYEFGNKSYTKAKQFFSTENHVDAHMWYELEGRVYDLFDRTWMLMLTTVRSLGSIDCHPKTGYVEGTYEEMKKKGLHYIPLEEKEEETLVLQRLCRALTRWEVIANVRSKSRR
jgi:hypothetical protein